MSSMSSMSSTSNPSTRSRRLDSTRRRLQRRRLLIGAAASLLGQSLAAAGTPVYSIIDLGVVGDDHVGSQAFGISPGGAITGRSIQSLESGEVAFLWTPALGMIGLPTPTDPALPFAIGLAVNDRGVVVGVASVDGSGAKPRPVMWKDDAALLLPLPEGFSSGRANAINSHGMTVGLVGSADEFGAVFSPDAATIIATTTRQGAFLQSASAINDGGRIVGIGIDPVAPGLTVGYVLDPGMQAIDIGSLPGNNGAECFAVSNAGHVAGGSNSNGGANLPFVWSPKRGFVAIPLPSETSEAAAVAVNSAGRTVGTASGVTSIPFLFDGTTTFRLADLLPPDSGWDLTMNSFASATGISEGGVIVGTGSYRGSVRAFAMIPPATCAGDLNNDAMIDGADLGILLTAWGAVVPGVSQDLNGDGVVDGIDLGLLLGAWGPCEDR